MVYMGNYRKISYKVLLHTISVVGLSSMISSYKQDGHVRIKAVVLGGELAVSCSLQSAIAGLKTCFEYREDYLITVGQC